MDLPEEIVMEEAEVAKEEEGIGSWRADVREVEEEEEWIMVLGEEEEEDEGMMFHDIIPIIVVILDVVE
eukprot:scaffold8447_cov46-Attheya_sp.AAC.1